jgi:hypothetical protein
LLAVIADLSLVSADLSLAIVLGIINICITACAVVIAYLTLRYMIGPDRKQADSYNSHEDDRYSRHIHEHVYLIDRSVALSRTAPGISVVADDLGPAHLSPEAVLDSERGEEECESKQLGQIEIDEVERRKEAFPVALEGPVPFSIAESRRAQARIRRNPDEQEPKAKSRRASRPKVKTGCNNCEYVIAY